MTSIRYCKRCVMNDSSDKSITFDGNGNCNYCNTALNIMNSESYFDEDVGKKKLEEILNKIKFENKNKDFDCVMGLSGGLDSSYLAYLGYKWGLRILGLHIDDGFDSEISKKNIEKLCNKTNIELKIIKPDTNQYNALILAYMKAGVPNIAIPQDNILFATIYDTVVKMKLKYFLSGSNYASESILQKDYVYNAMDVVNIKDIANKFSLEKIDKLKFISSYKKYLNIILGKAITIRPLNYINYNLKKAFKELNDFCNFEYYGGKHQENILTSFAQLYWFPKKFGVDKRYSHYSSLIISKQLTRTNALIKLEKSIDDNISIKNYIEYLQNKLQISELEFQELINTKPKKHENYKIEILAPFLRRIFFQK